MSFYSTDVYLGDGSRVDFDVTFDFLARDQVFVYKIAVVDGTQTELKVVTSGTPADGEFKWKNDQEITVGGTPLGSDYQIKIQRRTLLNQPEVDWKDGSDIIAEDLNTSEDQSIYLDQELHDWLNEITGGGTGPGDFVDIGDLGDVNITDPKEPEVLRYDGTTKKWVNTPNRDVADQDAGLTWDDTAQATAGAISRRHDNFVSATLPPGGPHQTGKFWFQDDVNRTLYIWNGSGWISIVAGQGTFTTQPSVIYVDAANGNDGYDGHRIINPKKTIRAAIEQANTDTAYGDGSIILVVPGTYQEQLPLTITAQNLSIVGQSLRSVFVHPTTATEEEVMFLCDSGTYLNGFTFAGLKASGIRGGAGSPDPDATYGLPQNQGWVAAFRPGAVIKKSPYVQNCTNFSDSEIDNDAFDSNSLPGEGGDLTSNPTGGGILIDGSAVAANSPLRSFVVDSFTQIALNGPGVLAKNNGYAQLVSFFGTFCWYHAKAISGGQLNLSNCTTDFGQYGLIADGKSAAPIFTAAVDGALTAGTKIINLVSFTRGTLWEPPREMTPADHMVVEIDGVLYPITKAVSATEIEIFNPASDDPTQPEAYQNKGLAGDVADGSTCKFYLQSYISTGGHTFEYAGSGTDYRAHPDFGGVPDDTKQTVEIGGVGTTGSRLRYINGGRVWQSSTDENGKFKVGSTFTVNQKTGEIIPVVAAIAANNLVRDPGINMRGYKIYQDPSDAGANAPLQLEPSGTGSIILGTPDLNSDGERVRPSPIMAPILENIPAGFKGINQADLNRSSPVLTQKDVGYDADEIPVSGLLGELAFTNTPPSVGVTTLDPEPNEIKFSVSGTTLTIKTADANGTIYSATIALTQVP